MMAITVSLSWSLRENFTVELSVAVDFLGGRRGNGVILGEFGVGA